MKTHINECPGQSVQKEVTSQKKKKKNEKSIQ